MIIGAGVGAPGAGAAIGGVVDAVTGALVGNELQSSEFREEQIEAKLEEQATQIEPQPRALQTLQEEAVLEKEAALNQTDISMCGNELPYMTGGPAPEQAVNVMLP